MNKSKKTKLFVAWTLAAGCLGLQSVSAATINIPAGRVVNLNWTAGNEYILQGFCYVMSPDVLNIQPGVVVKGVPGSGVIGNLDYGCLFICRGAQINAVGTVGQPIIFTSSLDDVNDPTDMPIYGTAAAPPTSIQPNVGRGYWGGIVILGNAVINSAVNGAGDAANPKYEVYEGLNDGPDSDPVGGTDGIITGVNVHRFGGNNDADNSGTLRYVSLRHGGRNLNAANKEINGLSIGGVGSGTTIEFVEVYGFADDAFEWWGGTVNGKYLVSAFNDDDGFDTDEGFRGKVQFAFNIHAKDKRDDLSEQNGQVNETAALGERTPVTAYQFRNATLVGPGNGSGGSGNAVMNLRVYNRARWYNSIFTHTANNRLSINQDSPGAPCPISANPFALTGVELHGNIWWKTTAADLGTAHPFFAAPWDNTTTVNPQLTGISYIPDYGLDPSPAAGSPALAGVVTPPADPFYTVTTYKGAFGANDHWMDGWTYLWERGFLDIDLNSVYTPAGDTTTVSCRSVAGVNYQFQSSTDGSTWSNVGAPIAGTGGTISANVSPTPAKLVFRVKRG